MVHSISSPLSGRSCRFDCGLLDVAPLGDGFLFTGDDGTFRHLGATETRIDGHDGTSLALAVKAAAVLSGGDDGRLLEISNDLTVREIVRMPRAFVNAIAVAPVTGLVAVAAGKRVVIYDATWTEVSAPELPSTVAGLAFDPKGKRVAAAHYGGASLWMAASPTAVRRTLPWKGSHLAIAWSPCGRFLVTAMQENAVHGWRIEDGVDFRMDGYPMRVKAITFFDRGKSLATTGAGPEVLVWPFVGPKGPMGKGAEVFETGEEAAAERLAARPNSGQLAVGYRDGVVRVFSDPAAPGAVIVTAAGAPVSALAWSADGAALGYGRSDGSAGIIAANVIGPSRLSSSSSPSR